jgi:hypothetical protein
VPGTEERAQARGRVAVVTCPGPGVPRRVPDDPFAGGRGQAEARPAAPRLHPVGGLRQRSLGGEGPHRGVAAVPERGRPEQLGPHNRVHPVGADKHVGLGLAAVRKADDHRLPGVLETGAARPEVDGRRVDPVGQEALQLGPLDSGEADPPPLLHQLGPVAHQPRAVRPPDALPGHRLGQPPHLAGQADRFQRPEGVGPQADPRPDLFERRRLFVDVGGQAPAGQGHGSGQPSDSAAHDDDLRSHASPLR